MSSSKYTAVLHLSFSNSLNHGECGTPLVANTTARVPYQFAVASGMDRYSVCPECWALYVEHRDQDDIRRRAFLQAEERFQNLESGNS